MSNDQESGCGVVFLTIYCDYLGGYFETVRCFNHVRSSPYLAFRIGCSDDSTLDDDSRWQATPDLIVERCDAVRPDVAFLGGRCWRIIDPWGYADPTLPIINLVQHVRNADSADPRLQYLGRKAIRLCASPEMADAVIAAGGRGPTIVISTGIDVPPCDILYRAERTIDLLIAGLKHSDLATGVAEAPISPRCAIKVPTASLPRDDFLDAMGQARVMLFLTNEQEWFCLPALEGMALGTIVVCPDCVGNRSLCLPGINAFRPSYRYEEIVYAPRIALDLPESTAQVQPESGYDTVRRHGLNAERPALLDVLHNVDQLWGTTNVAR